MLVRLIELVANKCGHAWFDPTRTERNQPQPDVESDAIENKQGETRLSDAVDQTQPQDRVVFPKETIGQPATEQRKKVNADDERVKDILRCVLAIRFRQIDEQ